MCFLAEGDSAASSLKNARDPQTMGVFPLRGKPINAYEVDIKRLMQNEEFKNILAITGLQIGEKVEETPDSNDWYSVTIDGEEYIVNGSDEEITVNNKTYKL